MPSLTLAAEACTNRAHPQHKRSACCMCPAGAPCRMGCLVVADEQQLQCDDASNTASIAAQQGACVCSMPSESRQPPLISGMTPGI